MERRRDTPDLVGKRFGYLTVLSECPERYVSPSGNKCRKYRCKCECGAEFDVIRTSLVGRRPPHSCRECAYRRLGKSRGFTPNLQKGAEAAKRSPKSGAFETNVNGKHWIIKSPEGKLFEFDNLAHFLRGRRDEIPNQSAAAAALGHDGKYHGWCVLYKSTRRKHEKQI